MFKPIIGILIFCIVVFVYLHIQFHLKTSEDLEIYELEETSKDRLEEICDLRQPVLFEFECSNVLQALDPMRLLKQYHAFEIKVRNVKESEDIHISSELYVPFPLKEAMTLFEEDKFSQYITERNEDFLNESGIVKVLQNNDSYLRPYMVSNCNYDILTGSNKTVTPFRYELNYRNFFLCTKGSVKIKLSPPHSIKYLHPIYDYENFEFRSRINPWSVASNYKKDFEKIKCLEVTLEEGKSIFIPPYWLYSIEFSANPSFIVCLKYKTYMNNVAILPYTGMYFLQNQNIKRNSHKIKMADSNDLAVNLSEEEDEKDDMKHQQKQTDDNQIKINNDHTTLVSENNALNAALNTNNDMFLGSSNKLLFSEI
jgi:hypothetical protein